MKSLGGTTVIYDSETSTGLILRGYKTDSGAPVATADVYAPGAEITSTISGIVYKNNGTTASPSFQDVDSIGTSEIADGAVTPVKSAQAESVTATVDGLTTGLISDTARHVTVTSDNADKIVTLPASVVGKVITMYVGATGCEVRTTASSNIKINDVDSDGTNEAAIPATTLCTFVCTSATTWLLTAVDELGAVITAIVPDAA